MSPWNRVFASLAAAALWIAWAAPAPAQTAPPLKIVNGSGSPLRVLALVPG